MVHRFPRRTFLRDPVVAGAGLALAPSVFARSAERVAPVADPKYAQRPPVRLPVTDPSSFRVPPDVRRSTTQMQPRLFLWLVILLIALGIVRSAIATRLDGFTIDEAYHIAAGVSYVRFSDFRINPEHPPLVKLWVGSVISLTGFKMAPLRQFSDKPDERGFTETLVFQTNDADSVQRRARTAMYMLNGLLLGCVAFALRRAFNSSVALATLLFLIIDPTVAAHWPVVMTDLPVALLSASAIVWATIAFQDWAWHDVALCSLFLGLALITKHSAPVVLLIVTATGVCLAVLRPTTQLREGCRAKVVKGCRCGSWCAGHTVGLVSVSLFRDSWRSGVI